MSDRYANAYKKTKDRYEDNAETADAGDEEVYDENADEDFDPEATAADGDGSSSSEDEEEQSVNKSGRPSKKRKADVAGDLDSGDEATIKERSKKRKKKDAEPDESEGEAGGLIKTRAQRLAEKTEKKQRRRVEGGDVTIDVEEIWESLNSIPLGRPPPSAPPEEATDTEANKENAAAPIIRETIIIKRRIEYAGEVTEVEEEVAKDSKEAQAYLKEHPEADPSYVAEEQTGLQRPLKRPSVFEPNPAGLIKGVPLDKLRQRAPSRQDVLMMERKAEEERKKKAEKMTTVQKSAIDWRGFVDQEGLREELDEYGKSRGTFLAREAFLDKVQGAREDRAREARLKG